MKIACNNIITIYLVKLFQLFKAEKNHLENEKNIFTFYLLDRLFRIMHAKHII